VVADRKRHLMQKWEDASPPAPARDRAATAHAPPPYGSWRARRAVRLERLESALRGAAYRDEAAAHVGRTSVVRFLAVTNSLHSQAFSSYSPSFRRCRGDLAAAR
jgi:hypothetical protein